VDNRRKVLFAFVTVATIGYCAALATVSFLREDELSEHLEISVESDLRFRLSELETYRETILSDVNLVANVGLIRTAISELSEAYDKLGPEPAAAAQKIYIADNPYPPGSRDSLLRANDASDYSRVHGIYHGWLRATVGARDYYDLLLVRRDGTVIYSVSKQDNFGANLRSESESVSPLGKVFDAVIRAQPDVVHATPFLPQSTIGNRVAQYVGVPIFADGAAIGALIVQVGVDRINRIVRENGLGLSGLTTYIATSDGRNLIRPGTQPNDLVRLAMNGAAGTRRAIGIDGRDVFAGFAPVRWIDGQMVLISEFDMKTADRRKWSGVPLLTLIGAVLVVLSALGGWLLGARDPQ
jgi:methyl-accepting chemotaxis protein